MSPTAFETCFDEDYFIFLYINIALLALFRETVSKDAYTYCKCIFVSYGSHNYKVDMLISDKIKINDSKKYFLN